VSFLAVLAISACFSGAGDGAGKAPGPVVFAGAGEVSPGDAVQDPGGTEAGDAGSVGSLFREDPGEGKKEETGTRGILFRMLGWVAALAVLAIAAVRIWKKVISPGRVGFDGGGLRVVGRTALTPRHFLYAVRVGNQRLMVVGVSGDRISPITEFDDPAQVLSLDASFQKTLENAENPEARPDREGISLAEGYSPYRQEVKKLVNMVKRWRGRMSHSFGTGADSGSGE